MEKPICYFHPNREATEKCAKCGKFLCLECQKNVRISSGVSDHRSVHIEIYCSECKKIRSETQKKIMKIVLPIFGCFFCLFLVAILGFGGFMLFDWF